MNLKKKYCKKFKPIVHPFLVAYCGCKLVIAKFFVFQGQTICSLFLLSWLLFKHPRLHRNLLILWQFQNFSCRIITYNLSPTVEK